MERPIEAIVYEFLGGIEFRTSVMFEVFGEFRATYDAIASKGNVVSDQASEAFKQGFELGKALAFSIAYASAEKESGKLLDSVRAFKSTISASAGKPAEIERKGITIVDRAYHGTANQTKEATS